MRKKSDLASFLSQFINQKPKQVNPFISGRYKSYVEYRDDLLSPHLVIEVPLTDSYDSQKKWFGESLRHFKSKMKIPFRSKDGKITLMTVYQELNKKRHIDQIVRTKILRAEIPILHRALEQKSKVEIEKLIRDTDKNIIGKIEKNVALTSAKLEKYRYLIKYIFQTQWDIYLTDAVINKSLYPKARKNYPSAYTL